MLKKLNKKNEKGQELYQEMHISDRRNDHAIIYGKTGTLQEISITESQRRIKRHPVPSNKVQTNRKKTKGRRIYIQETTKQEYQRIPAHKKRDPKTGILKQFKESIRTVTKKSSIRHIQETSKAIKRKEALLAILDKIQVNKSKWLKNNPEFKRKAS